MINTPAFATDCHMHAFGDPARYKPAAKRAYTPVAASLDQWREMAAEIGLQRVVLVQPSAYGTDNRCMLDALAAAPAGLARAVAVIDLATPDAELTAMKALGVCGVRLNLITGAVPDPATAPALLKATAARIAPFGWHLQLLCPGEVTDAIADLVPRLGVPVVFDHMGSVFAARGLGQPGMASLLGLLRAGECWVKVSGADHVAARRDAFEEAVPIQRALIEANPDRAVWGTDWPHIAVSPQPGIHDVAYLPLDNAGLLAQLKRVAGPATQRILVDNPARLYGWV